MSLASTIAYTASTILVVVSLVSVPVLFFNHEKFTNRAMQKAWLWIFANLLFAWGFAYLGGIS